MIGIIVNPNAHGLVRDMALPDRLRAIVGDEGEVVSTRNPDELRAALARFRELGITLFGTCGGDGTNLYALTELVRQYGDEPFPDVAILRGGTVNTIANCVGVRGTPEQILTRIVEARRSGGYRAGEWDLLEVADLCGFMFGSGLAGRFFEAYYAGSLVGLPMAALLASRTILSALAGGPLARRLFEPMEAELWVDGRPHGTGRYTLVLASTLVRDVGLGVRVLHQAGLHPGRFHFIASQLPPKTLAMQFPRALAARPMEGPGHLDCLAREVEIRFARPQPYLVEGDLFRATSLTLRTGPRLRIARA